MTATVVATAAPVPRTRDRRTVLLVVLVWAWAVIPRTIQTLTAPKYRTEITGEAPPYTVWTSASLIVLGLLVLAYAAFLTVDGLAWNPRRRLWPLVLLLLPWLFLEVRDLTVGTPLRGITLLYPAVLTAIWARRPGGAPLRALGYLVVLTALVSLIIGFLVPAQGTLRSVTGEVITENKTLLPLGILVGIFTHGNNVGQFLVLGLPAVAMIRRTVPRILGCAVVGLALVWCASRAALATVAVLGLAMALLSLLPAARRGALIRVVLLVAFAVVVAVPLLTDNPVAFNNRGGIWGGSLQAWPVEPLFGWGSQYYIAIAESTENLGGTAYHGHNQFVQLLITGGLVLLALVAVLIVSAIEVAARRAEQSGLFGAAFLLALAGACILEPSMVFVDNYFLFPVFVVPLGVILLGHLESPANRPSLPAPAKRRVGSSASPG